MKNYPYVIGSGAEGRVVRLSENLVMKVWFSPLFISQWPDVVERIKAVPETLKQVNCDDKDAFCVPEFAGYEVQNDGTLRTYHEYVETEQFPFNSFYSKVSSPLNEKFIDVSPGNVRYSNGKFWLVDIVPIKK